MNRQSLASLRRKFSELGRVPISFSLGSYHVDMLYWGWLGGKWWRNYLHTHSFFEICCAHDGRGFFEMEGKKHVVRRGDVFVARPHEPHEIISDRKRPLGIYFWAFTLVPSANGSNHEPARASIDALLTRFITSKTLISRQSAMAVQRTCEMLLEEIADPQPGYTRAIESLAAKLVLDTARSAAGSTASAEQVQPATRSEAEAVVQTIERYLRDNFSRPIGIRDLAAQVHLSQRHISRIFKFSTSRSIGQYLTELRIEAASQMLIERKMPIKQIARAVGYSEIRYFTTLFGRRTGQTPAAFRRGGGTKFLRRRKK